MPPRFAYWTILAGGLPTSFRASDRDELLPTYRRLKEKHPDAEMKYFARGKLWDSPDDARRARAESNRPTGDRREDRPGADRERRGRDWRPGGEHRDPRQRFKDAKKARNQDRREQRWSRKNEDRRPFRRDTPATRPHGDPLAPRHDRGPQRKSFDSAPGRPSGAARRRPPRYKPHGDKVAGGRVRGDVTRRPFKPAGPRRFDRNEETPPRPPRPDREPPPGREPKPGPPPRPSEPEIKPPGPPERGRESKGIPERRKRSHEE